MLVYQVSDDKEENDLMDGIVKGHNTKIKPVGTQMATMEPK